MGVIGEGMREIAGRPYGKKWGGGAGGTRTPYLYNAIVALSQMSYSPTGGVNDSTDAGFQPRGSPTPFFLIPLDADPCITVPLVSFPILETFA